MASVPGLRLVTCGGELAGILNDLAVEFANDVAVLESGFVGRPARGHVFGKGAGGIRHLELLRQAVIQVPDLKRQGSRGSLSRF